jgi:cystathionine beta-synthase
MVDIDSPQLRSDVSSRPNNPESPSVASFAEFCIMDCIGRTPLVALNRLFPQNGAKVFAKLEFLHPTGSIKDRVALYIIAKAEKEGRLTHGSTIIEASSGNMATSVAMIAAARGYRAILVMPEKASREKQAMVAALGAEIILCRRGTDYIQKAADVAKDVPNSFLVDQYNNPDNAEVHFRTTGPEIWDDIGGKLDYLVAGASTGGTVSGIGRYLKNKNPSIKIIVPDPVGSVYGLYHQTGDTASAPRNEYLVEGVGKDRLVSCMDFTIVDEFFSFTDTDAFSFAKQLAREEGIFAGGSSGANIWACHQLAKRVERDSIIVTILPDSGLKYISTIYGSNVPATAASPA